MGTTGHILTEAPRATVKLCRIELCPSPQHTWHGTGTQALSRTAAVLHGATENSTSIEPPVLRICMVLPCAVQIHQHRETMKRPTVMETILDHTWRI